MRFSRWSSLGLSALSALALAPAAHGALLAAGGTNGLSLLNGDGSGRITVSMGNGAIPEAPSWSPDGRQLVMEGTVHPGDIARERTRLYVMEVKTGRVAALPGGDGLVDPAWSPDGASIAATAPGDPQRIVVLPAAGGTPRRIAEGAQPAWSPDGGRLAFSQVAGTTLRVVVASADGSGARTVVTDAGDPTWSPDGGSLAFVSTKDHNGETCYEECSVNGELHVVGVDGAGERRLTTTKADETAPAWSPDGTRIAYQSDRGSPDAGGEIFAVDPDGGCPTQLTWRASQNLQPAWNPTSGPAERGPCGGTTTHYVLDLDVFVFMQPATAPLWLGPRVKGAAVAAVQDAGPPLIVYGECTGFDLSRCPVTQLQDWTVCRRNPVRLEVPAVYVGTERGALVLGYGDGFDVISGATTTVVFASEPTSRASQIRPLAALLRPLTSERVVTRLARPRLPRGALRALRTSHRGGALGRSDRRVYAALRRLHATNLPPPSCAR